jgi:hypothetical protein
MHDLATSSRVPREYVTVPGLVMHFIPDTFMP